MFDFAMNQLIFTLYLVAYPNNYTMPRYQTYTDTYQLCSGLKGVQSNRIVYALNFFTSRSLLGGPVEVRLEKVEPNCVEPLVKPAAQGG